MRTADKGRILGCVLPLLLGGCVLEQNLDLLEYSGEDVVETDGMSDDAGPEEADVPDDAGISDDGIVDEATLDEATAEDVAAEDGPEDDGADEDGTADDGGGETCNGLDDDGDTLTDEGFDLETDERNCGSCGISCTNLHGATECLAGACSPSCDATWGDCNGNPTDGCETNLSLPTACGLACGALQDCTTLPDVTTTRCSAGSCVIDACALSRSECNDLVDDGCERELDAAHAICSIDANLTALSGDSAGPPSTADDWGDRWYRVFVTENDGATVPLTARVALDVPPDLDYDLFVYAGGACEVCLVSSSSGSGVDEVVLVRWEDTAADDSRSVYVWVRFSYGSTLSCGDWTLTVTGNAAVAEPTC